MQLWHLDGEALFRAVLACVLTVSAILAVSPWARRIGLVDRPGGRRLHAEPVPLTGGIGIFLGFAGLSLTLGLDSQLILGLLLPAAFLLLAGLLDDLVELGAIAKFGFQVAAASAAVVFGDLQIDSLGDLFGAGPIVLGAWAVPFTVFAMVGVINAVNMIDGMDGLAGLVVLMAGAWMGTVALLTGAYGTLVMLLILGGVVVGFLTLNFRRPWGRPAAVFMGESGSSVLGFLLAWFAIHLTQSPGTGLYPISAVWILALPIVDTIGLILRRGLGGRNPLHGARDHVHHLLSGRGLCHGATVATLALLCVAAGAVGVGGWLLGVSEAGLFGLLAAVLVTQILLCERFGARLRLGRRVVARYGRRAGDAPEQGHTVAES